MDWMRLIAQRRLPCQSPANVTCVMNHNARVHHLVRPNEFLDPGLGPHADPVQACLRERAQAPRQERASEEA